MAVRKNLTEAVLIIYDLIETFLTAGREVKINGS